MKRIPPVLIAALGAGLIGAISMVFGLFELNACFRANQSPSHCWITLIGSLPLLWFVYFCAGIGGAITSGLFGRSQSRRWVRASIALIAGAITTSIGGAIVGLCFGAFGFGLFDNVLEYAVWGSMFGFMFAFSSWYAAFLWILGFLLLDVAIGKVRKPRTLT